VRLIAPDPALDALDFPGWMMAMDLATYLPDDILTKLDRASMAVALEARVPLLDHRVVELSLALPTHLKIEGGRGKALLRRIAARRLPPELFDRPKQGFLPPLDAWLRGPLKEWARDLLNERTIREQGFFNGPVLQQAWADHQRGRGGARYGLWAALMFQAWAAEYGPPA